MAKTILWIAVSVMGFWCLLNMAQATLFVAVTYAASHKAAECMVAFIMHMEFMWACSRLISFINTTFRLHMNQHLGVYLIVYISMTVLGLMFGIIEQIDSYVCNIIPCAALCLFHREK